MTVTLNGKEFLMTDDDAIFDELKKIGTEHADKLSAEAVKDLYTELFAGTGYFTLKTKMLLEQNRSLGFDLMHGDVLDRGIDGLNNALGMNDKTGEPDDEPAIELPT